MNLDTWDAILVASLLLSATLAFGYRVYRLSKGGPMADVVGQAVLAILLLAVAGAFAAGASWMRWVALGYAALFALVVMPLWTLAILIPMEPRKIDIGFTAVYWSGLLLVGVAALLA